MLFDEHVQALYKLKKKLIQLINTLSLLDKCNKINRPFKICIKYQLILNSRANAKINALVHCYRLVLSFLFALKKSKTNQMGITKML